MAITDQYTHTLFVSESAESTFDESKGGFVAPEASEFVEYGECREESNGSGQKVVTADGELYLYFFVVYCPLSVSDVKVGSMVRVVDANGKIKAEKRAVKFDRRTFNARIWL